MYIIEGRDSEELHRLQELVTAVEIFVRDVHEARVRAHKAKILGSDGFGSAVAVSAANAVTLELFEDIGANWHAVADDQADGEADALRRFTPRPP